MYEIHTCIQGEETILAENKNKLSKGILKDSPEHL